MLAICFNLIFINLDNCMIIIKVTQIHINIICIILLNCRNKNLKNNLLISLVSIFNVQLVIICTKSIRKMGFNINLQTNFQQNNNFQLAEVIKIQFYKLQVLVKLFNHKILTHRQLLEMLVRSYSNEIIKNKMRKGYRMNQSMFFRVKTLNPITELHFIF